MARESDPIKHKRESLKKSMAQEKSLMTDGRLQRAHQAIKQHVKLNPERVKVDMTAVCIAPKNDAVVQKMHQIRGDIFPQFVGPQTPPAA